MIQNIGAGDPKSILLNAAENIDPRSAVLVFIRRPDGKYLRLNNEMSFEELCGMYVTLGYILNNYNGVTREPV